MEELGRTMSRQPRQRDSPAFGPIAHTIWEDGLQLSHLCCGKGDRVVRGIWPQFNSDTDEDRPRMVMSLSVGADSQATLVAQIRQAHHCAFWDGITPGP
jgi:hypothetical protein